MNIWRPFILRYFNVNFISLLNSLIFLESFVFFQYAVRASLVAQMVKNLPAMQETQVWSLGWGDPLEKGMETHSSILAWTVLCTLEPRGLQSMGSQRVGHDWATMKSSANRDVFYFPSNEDLFVVLSSHEMLKLKLQYFDHLMPGANSLEKTLMLGKIEGGRRGWQRMRW